MRICLLLTGKPGGHQILFTNPHALLPIEPSSGRHDQNSNASQDAEQGLFFLLQVTRISTRQSTKECISKLLRYLLTATVLTLNADAVDVWKSFMFCGANENV